VRRLTDAFNGRVLGLAVAAAALYALSSAGWESAWSEDPGARSSNLRQAKMFLAAGDFRHAVDACRREVEVRPSVASYIYLTYVYQALDSYVEAMAKADRWVAVELLYLNLLGPRPDDLVDEPDVLARIAKEVIQSAVRRQADMTAALAARLDSEAVSRLWAEQANWRKSQPGDWWFGVPDEWAW
jgi:hypothetical protein